MPITPSTGRVSRRFSSQSLSSCDAIGRAGSVARRCAPSVYDEAVISSATAVRICRPERDHTIAIDDDFDARGANAPAGFVDSHTHLAVRRISRVGVQPGGCRGRRTSRSPRRAADRVRACGQRARPRATREQCSDADADDGPLRTTHRRSEERIRPECGGELKQCVRCATARFASSTVPPRTLSHAGLRGRTWMKSSIAFCRGRRSSRLLRRVRRARLFTRDQGERVLRAGIALGLIPRLACGRFSDSGGAILAASLGAASARSSDARLR